MTTKHESLGRSLATQSDDATLRVRYSATFGPTGAPASLPRCSVARRGALRDRREESAMQARSGSRIVVKGHHAGESDL